MRMQACWQEPHERTAHLISDSPAILSRINEPDVNICIWQRPPIDQIDRELVSLRPRDLPDVRCHCSLNNFDAAITGLLARQGLSVDVFKCWREDLLNITRVIFRKPRV